MNRTHAAYGALCVLNAVLVELAVQLGAGTVPIPADWQWVIPLLVAGITATTALLPSLRSGPAPADDLTAVPPPPHG